MYFVNNVFKHVKESAEKGTPLDKNIGNESLAYFKYNKALYTHSTTLHRSHTGSKDPVYTSTDLNGSVPK